MSDELEKKIVALCLKNIDTDLVSMTDDEISEYIGDVASCGNHGDTFSAGQDYGVHNLASRILNLIKED